MRKLTRALAIVGFCTSIMLAGFALGNVADITLKSTPTYHTNPVVAGDPLTEAIKSCVMIKLDAFESGGTGTIVGREKTEDGKWLYHILTAHHVIERVIDAIEQKPEESELAKIITLVTQNNFHGNYSIHHTRLNKVDIGVAPYDWAIFSCEIDAELPCAKISTREEFEAIQPYDVIYGVGSDSLQGLFFRQGVIGSTNGFTPFHDQYRPDDMTWDQRPDAYFRPSHNIWFGASGGPIFSRQGHIIGIYNGLTFGHIQAVPHAAVALKAYVIRELLDSVGSMLTTMK